jgi:hypothetical protein
MNKISLREIPEMFRFTKYFIEEGSIMKITVK